MHSPEASFAERGKCFLCWTPKRKQMIPAREKIYRLRLSLAVIVTAASEVIARQHLRIWQ